MEGRHFAVIASLIIWLIGYLISLSFFLNKYSTRIIPIRVREIIQMNKFIYLMVSLPIISSILSGLMYRVGGIWEVGNGIAWGCYIEDFYFGTLAIWFISFVSLFLMLLISLVKPTLLSFDNRKNALKLYFFHHIYTLLLSIVIYILIPFLSGPLSGKNSSCW
jgi:hypothetical protein